VVSEELLVEEADRGERTGAEPHGAPRDPLHVPLLGVGGPVELSCPAEGDEALPVRHPAPREPEPLRILAREDLRADGRDARIPVEHAEG